MCTAVKWCENWLLVQMSCTTGTGVPSAGITRSLDLFWKLFPPLIYIEEISACKIWLLVFKRLCSKGTSTSIHFFVESHKLCDLSRLLDKLLAPCILDRFWYPYSVKMQFLASLTTKLHSISVSPTDEVVLISGAPQTKGESIALSHNNQIKVRT